MGRVGRCVGFRDRVSWPPWALDAELKDGAARGQRDGSLAPNDGTSHTYKAATTASFAALRAINAIGAIKTWQGASHKKAVAILPEVIGLGKLQLPPKPGVGRWAIIGKHGRHEQASEQLAAPDVDGAVFQFTPEVREPSVGSSAALY